MKWQLEPASRFSEFHEFWDTLNQRGTHTPLLDSAFWQLLLNDFGTNRERVALCTGRDGPCAAALVVRTRAGIWQTFQPAQAPIGAWLQRPDAELEPLMRSLLLSLPTLAPVLGVMQLDPSITRRPEDGKTIETMDYIQTARVSLTGSFEDYWSQRGKNLRQNMRRQRNRLQRDEIEPTLAILSEPNEVARGVDEYGQLESQGWKAGRGTALSPDNLQGRLYRELLVKYARCGAAAVYQYRYNGALVACDLSLQRDGIMYLLKTTHDETQKSSSPASLMRETLFQRFCADGSIHTIEFYGRVMEWHKRWSDEMRSMYHVDISRWAWLQRLRHHRRERRLTQSGCSTGGVAASQHSSDGR